MFFVLFEKFLIEISWQTHTNRGAQNERNTHTHTNSFASWNPVLNQAEYRITKAHHEAEQKRARERERDLDYEY